jgi:hypothetical protein
MLFLINSKADRFFQIFFSLSYHNKRTTLPTLPAPSTNMRSTLIFSLASALALTGINAENVTTGVRHTHQILA